MKDPSRDLNEATDVPSSCFPLKCSSEGGASLDPAAQVSGSRPCQRAPPVCTSPFCPASHPIERVLALSWPACQSSRSQAAPSQQPQGPLFTWEQPVTILTDAGGEPGARLCPSPPPRPPDTTREPGLSPRVPSPNDTRSLNSSEERLLTPTPPLPVPRVTGLGHSGWADLRSCTRSWARSRT